MSSITKVIQEEILRLTRKEIRRSTGKLRSGNAQLKRAVAELKRQCLDLERQVKQAAKAMPKPEKPDVGRIAVAEAEVESARPTAKMVRQLRKRFGISQREMGLLLGVSANSVNLWEHKQGRLGLTGRTKTALLRVRKMGKQQIVQLLEEM